MGWQEPICVEVLFITIFLWASIWGILEMIADRLAGDAEHGETRRSIFYLVLCTVSSVLLYATPGLTTCRVL